MSVVIVVGAQWGDEGKGKVVDLFTERADVVVRYGGGANAGHTLVIDGKKLVTHLVPSGVCHPGKACVLGDGMVIDPHTLLEELAQCQARGLLMQNELLIGLGAHVILPYHKLVDGLREDKGAKIGRAIGTTRRGIGPAYEMKAARRGIRMRDLLRPQRLAELVNANLDDLRPVITHLGGTSPTKAEVDGWIADALAAGERLRPYTGDAGRHVANAIARDTCRPASPVCGRSRSPAASALSTHVATSALVGAVPPRCWITGARSSTLAATRSRSRSGLSRSRTRMPRRAAFISYAGPMPRRVVPIALPFLAPESSRRPSTSL